MTTSQSVPANYIGVWQRHLLETTASKDDSSLVFWMQTQHHHIDIRLPITRNKISSVAALADYTDADLLILAQQQGFAGVTQVEIGNEKTSDVCQWLREIDFQPATGTRDIGKMLFTDENTLIETGLDSAYLELWRRLENGQSPVSFAFVNGVNHAGLVVPAYQMRVGRYVAYARPRCSVLPKASSLLACIDIHQPSREQLLNWLDMEISFGEIVDEKHWEIKHSTMPFKEGTSLKLLA